MIDVKSYADALVAVMDFVMKAAKDERVPDDLKTEAKEVSGDFLIAALNQMINGKQEVAPVKAAHESKGCTLCNGAGSIRINAIESESCEACHGKGFV